MWMSDKVLVQEELADNLAQLVHSIKDTSSGLLLFRTLIC